MTQSWKWITAGAASKRQLISTSPWPLSSARCTAAKMPWPSDSRIASSQQTDSQTPHSTNLNNYDLLWNVFRCTTDFTFALVMLLIHRVIKQRYYTPLILTKNWTVFNCMKNCAFLYEPGLFIYWCFMLYIIQKYCVYMLQVTISLFHCWPINSWNKGTAPALIAFRHWTVLPCIN